jgi:magnesium-transporting ATPase (P-type)
MLRSNVYNIFNLSLIGLATIQLMLGKPLDALLSIAGIGINIGLNIAQEMLARRRLVEIEQEARPRATVIRESKAYSIDPSEIVQGDILVAGPGDQILVDGLILGDGQITVDESMLTGDSQRQIKKAGDAVFAGSFCVSGRAAYEAHNVGQQRLIVTLTDKTQTAEEELTPLEQIINRVLRVLLLFVGLFASVFVLRYLRLDPGIPTEDLLSAASVIFSIAPAGLFFMILLTYASGTADLGRLGALVHQARSVESLAQTDTVCFAQAGILTGTHVEVDRADSPEGQEPIAESRLRQILGDYAHTMSGGNLVRRSMRVTFPGQRRIAQEEAPLLSLHGWSAISFDDDDLRGVYVLGEAVAMADHLLDSGNAEEEKREEQTPAWRRVLSPVDRLLGRGQPPTEAEKRSAQDHYTVPGAAGSAESHPPNGNAASGQATTEGDTAPGRLGMMARVAQVFQRPRDTPPGDGTSERLATNGGSKRPNLFSRLTKRMGGLVRRDSRPGQSEEEAEDQQVQETTLCFAYVPDLVPLHDTEGRPQLPDRLIPLCNLRYTERVRPEAVETIRSFGEMGLSIKIFSPRDADQTAALLRQAGLGTAAEESIRLVAGPEIGDLPPQEWTNADGGHTVFGQITPEQAGLVVRLLREQGQAVAVVGDGVNDLPALLQANVAVARRASSQAALSVADIVLLEESPAVLTRVMDKGQRIVNGLLDVLKLYLTQVLYIALLILGIQLFSYGFPYLSSQGTVITIATVSLPSIGLSLWAAAGIQKSASFRWTLARFVLPAAISLSGAALVVHLTFLETSGEIAYVHLAVTHFLVAAGVLIPVFLKPPLRASTHGIQAGDWRLSALSAGALVLFVVLTYIPLAQELLKIGPLHGMEDYATVAGLVLAWAIVLLVSWRIIPGARKRQQ